MEAHEPIDELFLVRLEERLCNRVVSRLGWWFRKTHQPPSLSVEDVQASLEATFLSEIEHEKQIAALEGDRIRKSIHFLESSLAHIRTNSKIMETAVAYFAVKADRERLHAPHVLENIPDDCIQYHALLASHTRYIQLLERDKAAMGLDFPYHKRTFLQERRKREIELQQHIKTNCASFAGGKPPS